MKTAHFEHMHTKERILERRAKRARRPKWLGRLLFSLIGVGIFLVLRMHPTLVTDVVAYAHQPDSSSPPVIGRPSDIQVRIMPTDAVPVRRGLHQPQSTTARTEPNMHATAVSTKFKSITPGG